jgi:HPt (histidine-containing phosphotransfer) domain-containing protein
MFRSMAELAFDALPGSGLARVAFDQIRARIRADLEDELDALKAERERDQQTISRLTDVVERQQQRIDRYIEEAPRRD